VTRLEQEIDAMEAQLSPMKNFILPGGAPAAAALHLARTICRRAERHLIAFRRGSTVDELYLIYLNRLSDYLFVCARFSNHLAGQADIPW
jgi:cob(I)alamin adenosyltransferase